MLIWLVPVGLFWSFAALYLGGFAIEFEGGSGPRQVLGLLVTYVLFLVVWYAARLALGGLGIVLGEIAFPLLVAVLTLPLTARIGFGLFGTRIRRAAAGHG